jgi:hypothetical protein
MTNPKCSHYRQVYSEMSCIPSGLIDLTQNQALFKTW